MSLFSKLDPHTDKALAGLRIISGLMFMQHGAQKKEVALAELLQIERSGAAGADAALRLFFRDAQHPQAPTDSAAIAARRRRA